MQNRERPATIELHARLLVNGTDGYDGDVVHTDHLRLVVNFPAPRRPSLPVGDHVRLLVSGQIVPAPVETGATIVYRRQDEKHCIYQFEIDDTPEAQSIVQQNRRRASRVRPDPALPVPVEMHGEYSDERVRGTLRDVSTLGIAVSLTQSEEEKIHDCWRLGVGFRIPGTSREVELVGDVRYRRLSESSVVYGVEFVPEETKHFEAKQAVIAEYVKMRQEEIRHSLGE